MAKSNPTIVSADENWKNLLKSNPKILNGGSKRKKPKEESNPSSNSKKLAKPSSTKDAIWFDNVDSVFLEPQNETTPVSSTNPLVKTNSFHGLTRIIAIDCEMVGNESGDSILARVSIVNQFGQCVYDKYVKPDEKVADYRTHVSGIRPSDLEKGEKFKVVQKEVSDILKKRILVGHSLQNDFKVLFLSHPKRDIRDTSKYKHFRKLFNGKTPSLKNLTHQLLGVQVQTGEHDSVQDAQAAMRLYTMNRKEWEAQFKSKRFGNVETRK